MAPEHRRSRTRALILGAILLNASLALPSTQERADRLSGPPPGGVTGKVLDADGRPLPGVQVTLRRAGDSRATQTDAEGIYCFCRAEPARDYTLVLEREGFASMIQKDFYVGKRKVSVENFIMRPLSSFDPAGKKRGE